MGEPSRPARFPFVAAALCAACVGAAAWLWMAYSFCWEVTPDELREERPRIGRRGWVSTVQGTYRDGPYVRVRGKIVVFSWTFKEDYLPEIRLDDLRDEDATVIVHLKTRAGLEDGAEAAFAGRAVHYRDHHGDSFHVLATRSRFTGESVAGIVVGAMGVFVFAVAFRHWLGERRARNPTGMDRIHRMANDTDPVDPVHPC